MYIALHLLYKKYDFRYTEKQSYLSAVDKRGKIDRVNRTTINNVQLSEVVVEDSKIQKLERD